MGTQPQLRHKEVEAALEAGFNPDYTDSFGHSDAVQSFDRNISRLDSVDSVTPDQGNSLFHIACQNGNKRIAKLVNNLEKSLEFPAAFGVCSMTCCKAIKYGGDMDAQNLKGLAVFFLKFDE